MDHFPSDEYNPADNILIFENKIASKKLLTVKELALWLNIKVSTLYNLVHQRAIPYLKVGNLLRFEEKAIERWLTSRRSHVD